MGPRPIRRLRAIFRTLARSRRWQVLAGTAVAAVVVSAVVVPIALAGGARPRPGAPGASLQTRQPTAASQPTTTTATTEAPSAASAATSTAAPTAASTTTSTVASVSAWPTIAATRLTAPEGWGLTLGPDGNIWYVTGLDVARVTPSGQVTLFPYNDPLTNGQGTVSAITTGPDGNLWFTMLNGDKIGRITPTGDITEFDTPARGMIVTGSDGDLWFGSGQESISKITTAGVVTTYPTTGSPQELAEGPDGNIWFTELGGLIGRITPDGELTEFSVSPTGGSSWRAIIAGADGNLWFFGDGQIGRITTSGVVSEWQAPEAVAADGVGQMARTSDGRIWFVTGDPQGSACSYLAELNPDGTESVWSPTPCIGFSKAITVGPDGNLWLSSGDAADSQGLAVIQPPPP